MKVLLHVLVNAVALWAAAEAVPGIRHGGLTSLLATALLFGVVNALIRPLLKLVTCPFYVLTLGLFSLVVNALMLMLTAWFGRLFGVDFHVAGFWPAFLGALIISIVSTVLSWVLFDRR